MEVNVLIVVNALTAARIFGVIPLALLVGRGNNTAAFGLFLLLALTDACDGHLARRYKCVTDWGKFFDPTADKAFLLTTIFILLPTNVIVAGLLLDGLFLALVSVEFALFIMALGRYSFGMVGFALGANWLGKTKVWVEVGLVIALFVNASARMEIPAAVQSEFQVWMVAIWLASLAAALCAALGSFIGHILEGYRRDIDEGVGRL